MASHGAGPRPPLHASASASPAKPATTTGPRNANASSSTSASTESADPSSPASASSPLSRFTSPMSSASNFSLSSPAGFVPLSRAAAASTPLSSLGGDVPCASLLRTRHDSDGGDDCESDDSDGSESDDTADEHEKHALLSGRRTKRNPQSSPYSARPSPSMSQNNSTNTNTATVPIRGPLDSLESSAGAASAAKTRHNTSLSAAQPLSDAAATTAPLAPLAPPAPSAPPPPLHATNLAAASSNPVASRRNQPLTSDLIRRVSSSKSHRSFSSSSPAKPRPSAPSLITTVPSSIAQPKATRPPPSPLQKQLPAFRHHHSVAQLEDTAEQFASSGSIETAIREAHQELKRSDSRRSSILVRQAEARERERERDASLTRRDLSRQSSIIGLNSAARGTYTPSHIMSPPASVSGDAFPALGALSRHGTGKGSVRSVRSVHSVHSVHSVQSIHSIRSIRSTRSASVHSSLAEIVENEPMALTQDALDEADRRIAAGEDDDDDEHIRASAHQHIDFDFDHDNNLDQDELHLDGHGPATLSLPVGIDHNASHAGADTRTDDSSGQMTMKAQNGQGDQGDPGDQERPTTSGSGGTFQQAQTAFQDFDGVHCDPDTMSKRAFSMHAPSVRNVAPMGVPAPAPEQRPPPAARPTSYLDPATGQQMLYYPARVPAMLNLPPRLSKNPKAAEHNARRSQVLSMMAPPPPEHAHAHAHDKAEARQSWLPEMDGEMGASLMDGLGSLANRSNPGSSKASLSIDPEAARDADSGPGSASTTRDVSHLRRPARITDAEQRKSRMSAMGKLPPQLRASAFFDGPAQTASIALKNGSATDTLDSILDASARAPVSAFTDHAFAGHLGREVYGTTEKKKANRKSVAAQQTLQEPVREPAREPARELRASKSRSSFFSLVGIRRTDDDGERRPRRRLSKNFDGAVLSPGLSDGGKLMAPDADERSERSERSDDDETRPLSKDDSEDSEDDDDDDDDDDENDDDEDDLAFQGAPTTLLAELQLRKHQQKLRTQPITKTFPNGMHSTLLELDTVAEIERNARRNRRVNLAWEDPAEGGASDDDEDVPLGVLFAAKAAGQNDRAAVAAEMHRPLGLMERKELEDNEPLSRRRDRLQGHLGVSSMYLRPTQSTNALRRPSMMATPSMALLNRSSLNLETDNGNTMARSASPGDRSPIVDEVEDEPLAARRLRMKAKEESELPRARPVSMAFSEELLGQFAEPAPEPEADQKSKSKAKDEEETLGQRRRRLQAEKEKAEKEKAEKEKARQQPAPNVNSQALDALTGGFHGAPVPKLARRLSMADILAAHARAPVAQDPREAERQRREHEAARAAAEQQQRMTALRAQMPQSLPHGGLGSGVNRPGGFMGGRFNDAMGGSASQTRNTVYGYGGYASQPNLGRPVQPMNMGMNMGMNPNLGMNMNMGNMYNGVYHNGMNMGAMQMQVPGQPQQVDAVERWRQSIQP